MKRSLYCVFLTVMALLTACTSSQAPPEPTALLKTVTLDATVKLVAGQTVYVPIYSQIYMWDQRRTMDLSATLSIRNTDLTHPIIISRVSYYDNNGKLIREYLAKPVELNPLASTSFVIEQEDTAGGVGAAFVVEWVAPKQVSAPVIESVMINTSGNQGLSFVSPGRVIKTRGVSQ
jgi:hypothetical protein